MAVRPNSGRPSEFLNNKRSWAPLFCSQFAANTSPCVCVLITEKSVEIKHGEAMEFITLEDVTALYDATLFPETSRRCCHLLSPNRPYVVWGLVEESSGVTTLTVHDLPSLEPMMGNEHH